VPPPYALASISALQFDHCGHRFASAALDGTVCTWQLEVGGRNNIRPTESILCFTGHAAYVLYFLKHLFLVLATLDFNLCLGLVGLSIWMTCYNLLNLVRFHP